MKKILQAIIGIAMAATGLAGWIIIVKNNAQGDLAFVLCILCITMFVTGLGMLANACGIITE